MSTEIIFGFVEKFENRFDENNMSDKDEDIFESDNISEEDDDIGNANTENEMFDLDQADDEGNYKIIYFL